MNLPDLNSDRFTSEAGLKISVQVPAAHAGNILDSIKQHADLKHGDYDQVAMRTAEGIQQFRSLPGGRNAATDDLSEVPCLEISFFIHNDEAILTAVLRAIYWAHPYEEPVIHVTPCLRTLHIRGLDEDNPNRFWNRKSEDWVPAVYRES